MTRAPHSPDFAHVETWIFDLDHTLYPPEAALFAQIEVRMTDWVSRELGVDAQEADRLRADYWARYGTTLSGMMVEHGTDPLPYLTYVHDIDFSCLSVDDGLASAIDALPGRKVVFTNGSAPYARDVLRARGLTGCFEAVYGIAEAGFHPKPKQEAFDTILARDGADPRVSAMFEDDPRNLSVPHALGMRTVHVAPAPLSPQPAHIHHHTDDLTRFLRGVSA